VKSYHDIVGDGGSRILEQVAEQRTRIADGLAGVRHLVAVGSGKGGVGKSTLTLHLAGALRARGLRVAILDADFNGPSQARMAGVQEALFVPGRHKVALPRTRNGIAVFSMGSLVPESEALEFESAADGESHTWRATREFALLGEILASFEWGALDLLLFDLPPGAERTVQYAEFLGPRTAFLLVTIPSEVARGVVARSVAALSKGPSTLRPAQGRPERSRGATGLRAGPTRLLGYVENMSGYYCRDCDAIKPLFGSSSGQGASPPRTPLRAHSRGPRDPRSVRAGRALGAPEPSDLGIPCLGTVPFDPELARRCDLGMPLEDLRDTPVGVALEQIAQRLLDSLQSTTPDMEPRR